MITVIIVAGTAKDPVIVPADRILIVVQVSIILHNVAMRIFVTIKIVTLILKTLFQLRSKRRRSLFRFFFLMYIIFMLRK